MATIHEAIMERLAQNDGVGTIDDTFAQEAFRITEKFLKHNPDLTPEQITHAAAKATVGYYTGRLKSAADDYRKIPDFIRES